MARRRKAVDVKDGTYYIYLRKSRKDLEREKYGDMETLARHEADLDEVCERDGYPISRKFKELVSGESIAERKEFQKLMELVSDRKATGVVVHAVDRLGRGEIDEYGWVLATLQRTGTLVITPGKVYDPTDPADYMALVMLMIVASGELAAQKERYKEGKNRSSKMGEFLGSVPPYGYDKVVLDKQKTLAPNDKADVVRMIFSKVAAHIPPGTIARELNDKGIRTLNGKTWRPIHIKRMVYNNTYRGMVAWGTTRVEVIGKEGFKKIKKQVKQDDDEIILVPGLHEAIVSDELWTTANKVLTPSHRTPVEYRLRNPLAGMLRCAKCGKAVTIRGATARSLNNRNMFRHRSYLDCEGWRECDADTTIAMVVDSLMSLAGDIELKAETGVEAARIREEELSALRSELASAERQSERLIDLYTADPPAITMDAFRKRNTILEEQMRAIRRRLFEIESVDPPDYKVVSAGVREIADILKDTKQDAELKNAMLRQIVDRIEIVNHSTERGKDDIELHVFLKDLGNIEL